MLFESSLEYEKLVKEQLPFSRREERRIEFLCCLKAQSTYEELIMEASVGAEEGQLIFEFS